MKSNTLKVWITLSVVNLLAIMLVIKYETKSTPLDRHLPSSVLDKKVQVSVETSKKEYDASTMNPIYYSHQHRYQQQKQSFEPNDSCLPIEAPIDPPSTITPTLIASYPGSGAKMTWNLIESLTNYNTGDDWYSNGRTTNAISTKTHYPHHKGRLVPFIDDVKNVVLLIRHPLHAIPSHHNYIWEFQHELPPHSTRASVEGWIEWRDELFETELNLWRDLIIYWMDFIPDPEHHMLLTYEELINSEAGPHEAYELTVFLQKYAPKEVQEHIAPHLNGHDFTECVWYNTVKFPQQGDDNSEEDKRPNPKSHRYAGPKERPYRRDQIDMTLNVLRDLQLRYKTTVESGTESSESSAGNLVGILETYIDSIVHNESHDSSLNELGRV